jgi:argininosuccinate lyase
LPFTEVAKIHEALGEDWVQAFDLEKALAARNKPGMPGPDQVTARIAHWRSV